MTVPLYSTCSRWRCHLTCTLFLRKIRFPNEVLRTDLSKPFEDVNAHVVQWTEQKKLTANISFMMPHYRKYKFIPPIRLARLDSFTRRSFCIILAPIIISEWTRPTEIALPPIPILLSSRKVTSRFQSLGLIFVLDNSKKIFRSEDIPFSHLPLTIREGGNMLYTKPVENYWNARIRIRS